MAKDPDYSRIYDEVSPDSDTWDEFSLSSNLEKTLSMSKKSFLKYFQTVENKIQQDAGSDLSPNHPFVEQSLGKYVETATAYNKAREEVGYENDKEKVEEARKLLLRAAGFFSIALRVLGLSEVIARCPYAKDYDKYSGLGVVVDAIMQARQYLFGKLFEGILSESHLTDFPGLEELVRVQDKAEELEELRYHIDAQSAQTLEIANGILDNASYKKDEEGKDAFKRNLIQQFDAISQ